MSESAEFKPGDRVQLSDTKGRKYTLVLEPGKSFYTTHGSVTHESIIGKPQGVTVTSSGNMTYLALRPLLSDFVLAMPRGAAVIYPKDAAAIVGFTDIYPGAVVVEAGVGSGALTCSLIRAIGETGLLHSFERREEFAQIAQKNVQAFFGKLPNNWNLHLADFQEQASAEDANALPDHSVDRVILDMLAPWECISAVSRILKPGGVVMVYVATTTQMSNYVEQLRETKEFTDPQAQELIARNWHVEGLAVRPDHKMHGHTGFLVLARRLAVGTLLPPRRIRPAKGAESTATEVKS